MVVQICVVFIAASDELYMVETLQEFEDLEICWPVWMVCRIDENMDDTLANVEGAQGQLLKYLNSISSNRWLIIKIFFVLLAFLLIFVVFVA
jgi:t-SNARE complex subunit (syntaxin)